MRRSGLLRLALQARELISLSPAESSAAAVPDIDDLLRASSLRRANNALAAAQPQHPLTAPPPPAAGGGAGAAAGEGPYADLLDLAGPSGDATGGGAAVQRPPTPGGLARSASHTRHASVAEEGEGPDGTQLAGTGGGGLRADHKLKVGLARGLTFAHTRTHTSACSTVAPVVP